MKFRQFLSVVPEPIQTAGMIIFILFVVIGPAVGFFAANTNGQLVMSLVCGSLGGIAMGIFLAAWLMCLGYVYEDARRRMMPPVLWVLVALLVPNLLGFLIYFAVRRPIAQPCAQCGQPVRANARFCSWCGHQGAV
jgi:Phospholipase_D-nuclease N-terminal/zinc-ribbon domain